MLALVFLILAIASMLYGFCVLGLNSGTIFYAVWFILATIFLLLALSFVFDIWNKAPHLLGKLVAAAGVGIVVLCCVETALVATHFNDKGEPDLDYLVVLGAQVKPDGPSAVLQYRLDSAIEYLEQNPRTLCIVSGAQGPNEPCTEAEGMRDYLAEHGVDENRIILEPQARNTVQNIQFSKELMTSPDCSVGIVTNNFHLYRAMKLAEGQGLDHVCGIATPSKPFYLPNNILREYFGITKDFLAGNF